VQLSVIYLLFICCLSLIVVCFIDSYRKDIDIIVRVEIGSLFISANVLSKG